MNKIFSIIIPTYNCSKLLVSTLNSVFLQDKSLFECIIVDGASNDSTINIIFRYKKEYPDNIKYISENDKGVYDAMNKGIALASGEYLYFIGAGDILYPNVLSNLKEQINNEDIICGVSYHVGKKFYFKPPKRKEDAIYLLFNHQSIFYKKKIFEIIGYYDLKYKIYSDNVLNKKIFANDNSIIKCVNTKIAKYLGNGISENETDENFKKDFTEIVMDFFGKDYLYSLYAEKVKINNLNYKTIIGWGTGGEYENSCKIKEFNIDYFVESYPKASRYRNKSVKSREELLNENKNNIFILVYSVVYYQEIRDWLEKNGFDEFKHFILMSDDILKLLRKIKLF